MARMRSTKQKLKECSLGQLSQWREHLDEIAQGGLENVGQFFLLLLGPQTMHRAAAALGRSLTLLAQQQPETVKTSSAASCGTSTENPATSAVYPKPLQKFWPPAHCWPRISFTVFFSVTSLIWPHDNYYDNDTLRRSCYWSHRASGPNPATVVPFCTAMAPQGARRRGYDLPGHGCRAAQSPSTSWDAPALRRLAECTKSCELLTATTSTKRPPARLPPRLWKAAPNNIQAGCHGPRKPHPSPQPPPKTASSRNRNPGELLTLTARGSGSIILRQGRASGSP